MPTTDNEAVKIVKLVSEYLEPIDALELLDRLKTDVAYTTLNYSVRSSIFMLNRLLNPGFYVEEEIVNKLKEQYKQMLAMEEWKEWHCLKEHEWIGLTEEEMELYKNKEFVHDAELLQESITEIRAIEEVVSELKETINESFTNE